MTTEFLIGLLLFLVVLSAFFSGSETGMMAINRYRLRHLAKKKNKAAMRVSQLLQRPDRLLGVILIGNTFANVFASAVATIIAVRLFGEVGIAISTFLLTFGLLIFAEVTPKTLAALKPERVAFPASIVLKFLLKLLYPFVWIANTIANNLLKLFKVNVKSKVAETLSREELRTLVHETATGASEEYQEMLLGILDLNRVRVEDIMVPRNEIIGIDLESDWDVIQSQLMSSDHTRLPLYRGSIDNIIGMLHARVALNLFAQHKLNKNALMKSAEEAYVIPEATPLNTLLLNFRQAKCRVGLVVDEYGDLLGLATIDDILEEIVGEFTTDVAQAVVDFEEQKDGSYLIDGGANIRELNRDLNWGLPTEGPKTLSGLIVERLEAIPQTRVCLNVNGYKMEIIEVEGNLIDTVKVWAKER